MSIKEGIIAELNHETNNTKRILNNLSNDNWDYKPHEKSMALGALASHIVELHGWVANAASMDVFDFHKDYKPMGEVSLEDLKQLLEDNLQKNIEFVNSKDDAFWLTPWTLKDGDNGITYLPKRGEVR